VKAPTEQTVRRLFALSGNRCAFHQCSTLLVHPSGTITGEICHIKAKSCSGPRFDANQTDEERHAFANLVLLCSQHHKVVDDQPNTYTVELLQDIKKMHEEAGNREITQEDARLAKRLRDSYLLTVEEPSITQTVSGDGNVVAGRDVNINPRVVRKNIVQPGPEHVTEQQKLNDRLPENWTGTGFRGTRLEAS
jgi:5-methylcytosine-specific restriction endonuclease McrA